MSRSSKYRAMQIVTVALSGTILALAISYYGAMTLRNLEGARLQTLVMAMEEKNAAVKSRQAHVYIAREYGPAIQKARRDFLSLPGYWKDIHVQYLAASASFYYQGMFKEALKTLKEGFGLHPFFMNNFQMAAVIFDSIGLEDKAKECMEAFTALKNGTDTGSVTMAAECLK